jgi:hypothetical protein
LVVSDEYTMFFHNERAILHLDLDWNPHYDGGPRSSNSNECGYYWILSGSATFAAIPCLADCEVFIVGLGFILNTYRLALSQSQEFGAGTEQNIKVWKYL